MSTALLQIKGISKQYPGVLAVNNVSIELHQGEILGLVGKNGAGKSTVIKILAGTTQPDSGEMFLDGAPLVLTQPHDATVRGLSFVHQEFANVSGLSVAENIFLGLGYPKLSTGLVDKVKLNAQASEVLREIGVGSINPRVEIGTLSIAEQRMVMIARGLSAKARILVLDEPTASLTDGEVKNLFRVLQQLSQSGTAIIYVSHRLEEIFQISHRVVVMRDGQITFDDRTTAINKSALIGQIIGDSSGVAIDNRRKERNIGAAVGGVDLLRVEKLQRNGVIEDISFSVKSGEILGIAGLVGAGRTELLRLVFGADAINGGEVFVNGVQQKIESPRDAMKAGIVFLPEDRRQQGLVMNFDIRENLTLASLRKSRFVQRLPVPDRRREISETIGAISSLNIKASSFKQPTRWLSGGNQQKVVLGKWLARNAKIFIFDEPTHGVDVGSKEEIYQQMERLASLGHAILFVSSEFLELEGVCNRVIVLKDGKLVGQLQGDQVSEPRMLELCYGSDSQS